MGEVKKESEALRLADLVDHGSDSSHIEREVAAELRRLHAVNAELTENLEKKSVAIQRIWKERDELRKVNAELLEALKELDSWLVCACIATPEDMAQSFPHMQQVVSAAIAKAEGEQA
jgi:hypothetical protein